MFTNDFWHIQKKKADRLLFFLFFFTSLAQCFLFIKQTIKQAHFASVASTDTDCYNINPFKYSQTGIQPL